MKRFADWLRKLGDKDDFTTPDEPLAVWKQEKIALEQALLNSLQLISLQKDCWNMLLDELEEAGVDVNVNTETRIMYKINMKQLQASMSVLGEINEIPKDLLDSIRNH